MCIGWVCHQTISFSVVPFSSSPQSFPAAGSFQMSQHFASGWPKYWSFSFNISPSNEHSGLIFLQSKGLSRVFSNSAKVSILQHSAFFIVQLSHAYMTTGKTIALTRWTYVGKVMSLLFNTLYQLVITVLARGKSLLIS